MTPPRNALVLGGTGAVGSAVVTALAARGLRVRFVYGASEAKARALAEATGASGVRVDLRDRGRWADWLREAALGPDAPTILVHAAAILGPANLEATDPDALTALSAINVDAPLLAVRALAPAMKAGGGGRVVLVGGLDRTQSLPIPPAFAATQSALSAAAMALAHALGRDGTRVNVVTSGLLDAGLGLGISAALRKDFLAYSALRRFGRPAEVARVVTWLALDELSMSGKVVPVCGGI